ncbi:DUF697 domain-containing protein [Candidatus Synechococcus calcipolaris G9]|uniref:DUF697 domain-containing protein n=1 Tax=Candidatus Synechococcus calcipolaris G9 TaxID=1497997 RepID=A0ABT6F2I5_9SYNE|nr:DUF697 domain-containing protein [Candidatus Synechococcus calcipolaris]MDG2992067.1 DUF697 domain-containing protein [Candidatus Synechococcus calcipolaris G9]
MVAFARLDVGLDSWFLILGGVGAVGYWWLRSPQSIPKTDSTPNLPLSSAHIRASLRATETTLEEIANPQERHNLHRQCQRIQADLERTTLSIGILGLPGVGKQRLQEGLEAANLGDCQFQQGTLAAPPTVDLVLFMINGDLTATEVEFLEVLHRYGQRLVLVWNQFSLSHPADLIQVKQALGQRLQGISYLGTLISLNLPPHSPAIAVETIAPVVTGLRQILAQERTALILASAHRQANAVQNQAKIALDQSRRDRALPVIQRYQWLGAGAAAINPIPLLDLVVTGGLLVRLTLELGQIYQRQFSLTQAQPLAKELLQLLVQLGAIEVGSQSLLHWLKGNSLTYLAGSCLQGASAAYLIQVSGLSLIEHFQSLPANESPQSRGHLRRSIEQILAQVKLQPLLGLNGQV